jgi:5-methylcytosine-specific restriction endonuclease McrA
MRERSLTREQKRLVKHRAHDCCEYCLCQARFATQSFAIEHISPRIRGGQTILDNLAYACQGCNNHKYDKVDGFDPVTRQIVSLYNPRQNSWSVHFKWSYDFTLLVGLTPIGRATVETLKLNRDGVINLRVVLVAVGKHPPQNW